MKTFVYVDVATGAVSSVSTVPDTVMPGDFEQIAGQALLDWSIYAPIDPLKFNESHWFQATAQGSGSWLLTLQTYTPAQKVAKAAVPEYPAVWSNVTMSWQDQRTLQQAKDDKWMAFQALRDNAMYATLVVSGLGFQADQESRIKLLPRVQGELVKYVLGEPSSGVDWTLADNTVTHLTASELFDISKALTQRDADIQAAFTAAREDIYAATTHAEVAAIAPPVLP